MSSQTKENYLKALYFLHQKNTAISVSDLSNAMGVSTPTANDMVKKLQEIGWVNYQKYKPLRLTSLGLKEAAFIVRKHRLSELFLHKFMGFGWGEVHDIAEEMEHIKSELFFDRMDKILGFPENDPHGSPIPDKSGNFAKNNFKSLAEILVGETVILKAIVESSSEFINFLNNKNIKLEIPIEVLAIESYDKSMTVVLNNETSTMLSHEVCKGLLVEK
jgi:DtxR family Mn-dependent transcriptional regulator